MGVRMADNTAKPTINWLQLAIGMIGALIVSAIGGGIGMYGTSLVQQKEQSEVRNTVAEVKTTVATLGGKIEALTVTVNATEKTAALVKNTLDEGIRQALSSQDRRITQLEERSARQADTIADQRVMMNALQAQVEAMRRASDVDLRSSPGRR